MKIILQKFIGFFINIIGIFFPKLAARMALFLFTKPLKGKPDEKQSDFLDTAFREELTFNNMPIMTYRWLGDKGTILLAHGWESNSARWKELITNLKKKGFSVVALDAPAHGRSGSNRFNAIIYSEFIKVVAERFQPNIIIGHSVGGMASAYYQYKYQKESIEKMILLGAPSEFSDVLKRYTDMLSYSNRVKKNLNLIIKVRYGELPEAFSTANYSEHITSKGLIIHDKKDNIIPYNDALLIKTKYKNSVLISTEGYGHSLATDEVSNYIYDFIDN
ncbi:alpha/beta hydrolase [Xanthomarina sp. F2636L]|uniref:alpha/beta hydrolase n=1 Tax=Xanthomarina sp. F2636L TaxID=2996018 RepID=UPI00225DDB68|nr:alpha/beta hydrolase [Xanthomarina sp. F2636L]MCX7552002.1 alpha/beta hydrolase [Xanthomarina sp. F2636L]